MCTSAEQQTFKGVDLQKKNRLRTTGKKREIKQSEKTKQEEKNKGYKEWMKNQVDTEGRGACKYK